jgi:hypothetical protein
MPTMTTKYRVRLVDPQGGRSPTAGSASRQTGGRWSSRRKTEVVLRTLRGETLEPDHRDGFIHDLKAKVGYQAMQIELLEKKIGILEDCSGSGF